MNVSDILFQFTPLREGRQFQPHKLMVASNFNSRPSARGDLVLRSSCRYQSAFQFTPLREGRPASPLLRMSRRYFNSRPSARGDAFDEHE